MYTVAHTRLEHLLTFRFFRSIEKFEIFSTYWLKQDGLPGWHSEFDAGAHLKQDDRTDLPFLQNSLL